MNTPQSDKSEIGRLMALIDAEYYSAKQALYSVNLGTAKHSFINARINRIGQLSDELGLLIGKDEALSIIVEQMDSIE
jgi:ribosome assembly protein YihI (activator of Der GTPase)